MSPAARPWYENLQQSHPFAFHKKIDLHTRIRCIEPFPKLWSSDSAFTTLWGNTKLFDPELAQRLHSQTLDLARWKEMIDHFRDALVVAAEQTIYIIWPSDSARPIQIQLHKLSQTKVVPTDKVNVAWALSPDKPYEPLVIFSYSRLVYIFNVETRVIDGCLRGHGGEITSIAVHARATHIFCTTSRDFTSRLYDLTRKPQSKPNNPHWPPSQKPSLAGPAHGLDMSFEEGKGIGRCVLVLMGGRSGGHQAEVLDAAFHDSYPVISTCGMDRTIKIWPITYFSNRSEQVLLREDKPLFSSSMIHTARVLSVNWLSRDILITHSAPARTFVPTNSPTSADTSTQSSNSRQFGQDEPGSLSLWKWLSLDRFFPPGWDKAASRQLVLRGFGSDYQESASFRILSNYFLPQQTNQFITPTLSLCREPVPFVIYSYPNTQSFNVVNVTLFDPNLSPPYSLGKGSKPNSSSLRRQGRQLQRWKVRLDGSFKPEETSETCIMLAGAKTMIAGGSKGSLCFFSDKSL
ncbi:hypothetical protein J3R30DRAFT_3697474 [Lentinula aciculospora]|uniref:WD40 repeat-like protein n=1 Tax=Lentinula aciculospora TaxID=153920 RepID=A0A9W9APR1_9AGAR|nr:hypothetical protein J3R30DRAFT_3697474 [Lentinula aciculospora]